MHQTEKYTVEELAATETILKCALKIPRSLFCPYCADEYMFDFSLKDHLLKHHIKELKLEEVQKAKSYTCPMCIAVFYIHSLIPKHVISSHGKEHLPELEKNYPEFFEKDKINADPSIMYAACSPGLSDIFDKMATNASLPGSPLIQNLLGSPVKSPLPGSPMNSEKKPKSILKKTPSKTNSPYKTINSPGVISVRRNKKEMIKRTLSARRELRFDLPPLEQSPSATVQEVLSQRKPKCFDIKKIFKPKTKKKENQDPEPETKPNIVTSTPINFLDDSGGSTPLTKMSKRKLKKKFTQNFRPLLFASERFQCAYCKTKFNCNGDLLFHLNDRHKGLSFLFRPKYQCGQCGDFFFMNNHLVRHCHFQHTPQKVRV